MENLAVTSAFWRGRRVLVTGHTGFKGSWLSAWLDALGASVTGFALAPGKPSLFELANLRESIRDVSGDIRDAAALGRAFAEADPEIVFHLAAQPLVRASYRDPIETFDVNVLGTARVLDAVRASRNVRAVVVVTSDKCYENREWPWPYRENDPLGGHDPYSASKACAEIVAASYRSSFLKERGVGLGTARAGNVIGGGDFAEDRIVPDLVRAAQKREPVLVRNPSSTRPWQFVLDPLAGYMLLAERLAEGNAETAAAWNFGPTPDDVQPVRRVANEMSSALGRGPLFHTPEQAPVGPHEASKLTLDSAKAHQFLGWKPALAFPDAIAWTAAGYATYLEGRSMRELLRMQIEEFQRKVTSS